MTSLTILGTAAPYPLPDRPCSGYLLQGGGARVWVDAGPGSLAELLRHTSLDRLDAVWLSHLHLDHIGDLLNAYYALSYGHLPSRAVPLPVYAPAALATRLAGFFEQPDADFVSDVLDLQSLSDGHKLQLRGLTLTSRLVEHGIEAYGLRAQAEGASLAYSGDCTPCTALDELAADVDLLLCEADVDAPSTVHHTPEDAGSLARRAGVKRLVVTHVGPALSPEGATARAAEMFGGPTVCATVGETLSPW
ncbi:MBL fold metallo-hydrolase [Kribbella qitaiheensis]|uniref:MBL fold metallo-hydrolase n=1 Tax=Kribbella qitaiheensis TaxID=1544730 RepID=A0A7G6XA10_9ACTN|nr:MBL fold metallo-hydrolase [Kribbella qitaiheensis]QNE23075.1 MBL fold metallo-hydrolase [Kribbella qitaiheensis]